ncbi:MAG TPA: hypothetical protein GXZ35_03170 [Acholeplasmataceae bacterium]|nr:hypothetical protein [Acholeplasmataceae bacterium]
MVPEDRKIPFPQANDFKKIYDLICLEDETKLQDKDFLKEYLSLGTERQISYYLSACEFLGIISREKRYTDVGLKIRKANIDLKVLMIGKLIISLPVFGEVFLMNYLYKERSSLEDIAQLISMIYDIDNYEVCKRRASTVNKWLEWLEDQIII